MNKKSKRAASTVTNVKTAKNFFGTEQCSNNMAFGLLTKTLNAGMFMTQTGANATKSLDSCRLENIKFQVLGIF